MDLRQITIVPVLVCMVAVNAHAQLEPGKSCKLKKPIKVTTKPKGKGKAVTLEAGSEVTLEQYRGKWMKLIAGGMTVWLKKGKLKNKCEEAAAGPVFEGLGGQPSETEAPEPEPRPEPEPVETATETITATETTGSGGDDDAVLGELDESSESEDAPASTGSAGTGAVYLGALAGLGGGKGGVSGSSHLTFDIALDLGWRFMESFGLGGRLFLHGTPGTGYGFGGLTVEGRYYLPFAFAGIEPYAGVGVGAGFGADGEATTGVFAARINAGGRTFVWEKLYVGAEVAIVISQLSAAGHLDVAFGWEF